MRSVAILLAAVALLAGCGGGGGGVRISIDHPVALLDQPFRITVSGLKPHERVVLDASTRDLFGKSYLSKARATADGSGRIELAGDSAMRLLWSVRPPGLPAWQTEYTYEAPLSGMRLRLRVAAASTTVVRRFWTAAVHETELRPNSDGFYGDFYAPPPSFRGRRPAILVFGGSEGGLSTGGTAALYASHGYPTLALAYFREPGLPHNLVGIPLEYFARALRWLAARPTVDPTKIAVEGISRGSEAAQLLGVHYPQLVHAVIAGVPSNGPGCGIKAPIAGAEASECTGAAAWTFRGRPLPFGTSAYLVNPHPFPDERIDGPVFLVCAGEDDIWPSCPMAERIVSRLRARDFRHHVTLLRYPGAGHGVGSLVPYYPGSDPRPLEGAGPFANQVARANAWPKLLAFLHAFADGRYS